MILVIIICGILYLFMIYGVISLYYTHRKDIEEIENRLLEYEKRIEEFKKDYKGIYIPIDEDFKILLPLCEKDKFNLESIKYAYNLIKDKEVDNMACKKGRGGRKK